MKRRLTLLALILAAVFAAQNVSMTLQARAYAAACDVETGEGC